MSEPAAPPPAAPLPPSTSAAPAPLAGPPLLPTPPHVEAKATLLLFMLLLLVAGAALYLSYARGAFEKTQRLVLIAEDSEGVFAGMDMTFAGFPIGRVHGSELAPDGNVRILIDVPLKDARWLRTSSVFAMQRGVVGNTNIRAYSGVLADPPLPDNAERPVLRGDATAEVPRLMAEARQLLQNLSAMTNENSAVNATLGNARAFTEKLNAPSGAMGALMGNEAQTTRQLGVALDRANTLLARLDTLASKTDKQVFGADGVMKDARATVQQLNAMLLDARASVKRVDAVLEEAKKIGGVLDEAKAVGANARTATADLGVLRADVETSLRNIDQLINEVNRKWPFARDTEVKLP